jgi:hypothetical protein
VIGRRYRLATSRSRLCPRRPGRPRELTTANGAASRSEHLLIRIIGHGRNGTLDLVRCAAR